MKKRAPSSDLFSITAIIISQLPYRSLEFRNFEQTNFEFEEKRVNKHFVMPVLSILFHHPNELVVDSAVCFFLLPFN